MADQTSLTARFDVQTQTSNHVIVRPCIQSKEGGQYTYSFTVAKTGESGRSSSQQGGKCQLDPDVERCLGSVTINLTTRDQAELLLEISSDGVVVTSIKERLTNI